MKSVGTDPLALTGEDMKWLVDDLASQRKAERAAQRAAHPTGLGGTLARAVPLGIGDLLHAVTQAAGANPVNSAMDFGLDMAIPGRPGIPTDANNVANAIAAPPTSPGLQTTETLARGAMAGAIGGPAGVAGGVGAGAGQDIAKRMGAGPMGQLLASLLGGAVGSGGATLVGHRGAANQNTRAIVKQMERAGEPARPQLRAASRGAAADPEMVGRELLGKPGQELAIQAASEGGEGGARIADAAVERFNQSTQRFLGRLQNTLGKRGDLDVTRTVLEETAAKTGPKWEQLRPKPVKITDELAALLDDPLVRDAYEAGAETYASRVGTKDAAGRPIPPVQRKPVEPHPALYDENGVVLRNKVPLGAIQDMKVGLDNLVKAGLNRKGRPLTKQQAEAIEPRLEAIRALVDKQYPEYGVVRAETKVGFDAAEDLEFGREMLKPMTTDDKVAAYLGTIDRSNPGRRIHVKMGLADAFFKGDIPPDWSSNPQLRARVQSLVTPDEFANLDKLIVKAVREQHKAGQVIGAAEPRAGAVEGSRLSRIGFEVFVGLLRSAARDFATEQSAKIRFKPPVRSEMADVLNAQGPDFQARVADLLRRQGAMETSRYRGAAGAGAASGARRE